MHSRRQQKNIALRRRQLACSEYVKCLTKQTKLNSRVLKARDNLFERINAISEKNKNVLEAEGHSRAVIKIEYDDNYSAYLNALNNEVISLTQFQYKITRQTPTNDIERMCAQLDDRILSSQLFFAKMLQRLTDIVDRADSESLLSKKRCAAPMLSVEKASLFGIKIKPAINPRGVYEQREVNRNH